MRRGLVSALAAAAITGPMMLSAQRTSPHDEWAKVLDRFVDASGAVDFTELAASPENLDAYLDWVSEVSPRSQPERFPTMDSKLSYYINSYNALAMHNVVDSGIPESLGNIFRRFVFFWWKNFTIGGERFSLYAYENDVIRPLGDERVHFALNCMVVSCPLLPREPFSADALDAQLEALSRRFFAERRNLRIDAAARTAYVSEILRFYEEDFVTKSGSLIAYINRYATEPIPANYEIDFIDYDWTIKMQSRADQP